MRSEAAGVRLVSGERIGGGLAADGLGELSKLLLGTKPLKALRLARDTGVLVAVLPELAPSIGFDQESDYHGLTLDEHTFMVVQAAADARMPLRVRLAALLHDTGKPAVAWRGRDGRLHYYARPGLSASRTSRSSAELARGGTAAVALPDRAPAPSRADRAASHAQSARRRDARAAPARALRRRAAFDLLDHKAADLRGKWGPGEPRAEEQLASSRPSGGWSSRSRRARTVSATSPSSGTDLIALGYVPGPALGQTLRTLLTEVVERPDRNTRDEAAHARAGVAARVIRWSEPGFVVGFTTRVGGVSSGPFSSLNLGRSTGDELACIDENRRRACASLGAEPARLAQPPGAFDVVNEAVPGGRGKVGDGLWSDRAGVAMLALAADCVPVAVAAPGPRPARRRCTRVGAGSRTVSSPQESPRSALGPKASGCGRPGGGTVLLRGRSGGRRPLRCRPDHERRLDLWSATERHLRPWASRGSSGSTSARSVTRSSSSHTDATVALAACRV